MAEEDSEIPLGIQWRIGTWFPNLPADVLAKLKRFADELHRINKTINLISAKTIVQADAIHFADSIMASQIIMKSNPKIETLYDLGSGNGFPGIIFAILYPKLKLVLVDSDQRKCEFLKHVVSELKLSNVDVQCKAIETLPEASIHYAICRGLANLSKAILLVRKQTVKGGLFFHMKGENWSVEIADIPSQLCSAWSPSLLSEYKLPVGEIKFSVIVTEKIS